MPNERERAALAAPATRSNFSRSAEILDGRIPSRSRERETAGFRVPFEEPVADSRLALVALISSPRDRYSIYVTIARSSFENWPLEAVPIDSQTLPAKRQRERERERRQNGLFKEKAERRHRSVAAPLLASRRNSARKNREEASADNRRR